MLPAFPVPVPPGAGPLAAIAFALMGLATLAVLIWQAVRYVREHREDDEHRPGPGGQPPHEPR
ncbi:hypothetical protein [Homoserinibacter sp. YIM 151385]|uniref:hypothetical protein n=1 Tax=Homoserinibacter sp. YIM 151385 TaxID=2985506 RepID=UPI0022F01F6F|nr:hypothetical protein [Homoserinibacter sp. YIM 151385]WBU38107.1 hypothetical protein OF852_00555 [Homoserinibacter sp. YIM 151385]